MTLPHNEQKYNTNQLSLHYIGNLAYRKSKTATSYDSVHSLTTHNNHYTLLYPDLVQELLNFHNSNSVKNNSPFLRNIGVNNTKYSSLDSSLSARDILFFLQIVSLYQLELRKGNASIIYASDKLSRLLGYNAQEKSNMRSTSLKLVKKLEQLGFLSVIRHKNKKGADEVNEMVPILSDPLYEKIKYAASNFNIDSRRLDNESNIQHILRTKLFTPIDLEFMKSLFDDINMSNTQKLFHLNCIITAYQNYQTTGKLSFSTTAQELISTNNVSKRTLARILNYIKNQYLNYFIEVNHTYAKSDDIDSNRYDRSTFIISINPIVIPKAFLNKNNCEVKAKVEYRNIDNSSLVSDNETEKPDTYRGFQAGVPKKHPSSAKKASHNNKDIIIKESNKNIDENKNNQIKPQTFLQTSNSEHLESELCSLSSKSLKNIVKDFMDVLPHTYNSIIEDVPRIINENLSKKNKINIKNNFDILTSTKTATQAKARNDRQHKDFRYFYPISEEDSNMLNFKANREFDTNFTNQLLLKLYIKYPEKKFKNKFTFSDYMVKALKKEKHQGPVVNNPSFRFSCNIGKEEKNLLEYERYLSQIENSFDTSKEMCVKKKIAGRFSTELAYAILTGVELKTNSHNSFITALIPSSLVLSERQVATLSDQLEAVYGINGYYVEIVTASKDLAKAQATSKASPEEMYINTKECSMQQEMCYFSAIPSTSAWYGIRRDLIAEFGQDIDNSWFSKAVVTESKETNLLTLTMPNKFMSDFIKSRYGYAISRISGTFGFKYIEYNY